MSAPDRLTAALGDRYRIERELGQGGMATVYLAEDLKHSRNVAIKVLKPELAAVIGAERFLREIRTIATLQHPHILGLIDSGELNGTAYYVMPFVEGESLRDRLNREKQLPITDATRIATEVASALDYAHRHNVIHRDIKPENILLHDGSALVADFGIALAISSAGGGSRMTETGMSLGTPQYMSPEQAMGERDLDARSDIYALGCVTYEMLAGEPPFSGPTAQAIVAKVMTAEPAEVTTLRRTISAPVADAVHTALQKLPADRFASAAAFAEALAGRDGTGGLRHGRSDSGSRGHGRAQLFRHPVVLGLIAITVAALAWSGRAWSLLRREPPGPVVRFAVELPASAAAFIRSGNGPSMSFSPDGSSIAFSGTDAQGPRRVYVRPLNDLSASPVEATDGATQPVFSPDGKWIAFWSAHRLQKISLRGGAPQVIADMPEPAGMTWISRGEIVYGEGGRLRAVSGDGGTSRLAAPLDSARGEVLQMFPLALPDGDHVLYSSWGSGGLEAVHIGMLSLKSATSHRLDVQGTGVVGMLDNNLVFSNGNSSLLAVPFDVATGRATGSAASVENNVAMGSRGAPKAAISAATGSLMFISGSRDSRLGLADARGMTPVLSEARQYGFPRYSPDGSQVAITIVSGGSRDVWLYDLKSRTLTRLSSGGAVNERAEWSPDGTHVLFRSQHDAHSAIWWRPIDMSAPQSPLLEGLAGNYFEAVMTADGKGLVYQVDTAGPDVEYRSLAGDTSAHRIAASPATEFMARLSPDGRWVAFDTDESGAFQVVVQPFPGPGPRVQVSADGGTEPVWSRDGRRIFYRAHGKFMVATVTTTPAFSVTSREGFMDDGFVPPEAPHANYDVSPDGRTLLVVQGTEERMVVVHNWAAEMRARLRSEAAP